MKKVKDEKGRVRYVLDETDKDLIYLSDVEKEYAIGREYIRRARRMGILSVVRGGAKQICKRTEVEALAKKIARGEMAVAPIKVRSKAQKDGTESSK